MQAVAYAKINLALHVRARRSDGYHELETLFAFVDDGDRIACEAAARFELVETGEFAGAMGASEDNLITRAARLAHGGALPDMRVTIDKRLPVAAGLGGGSADAAAVLRLLAPVNADELAPQLGADVPACLASRACIGLGTGTQLHPVQNDLAGTPVLLVNPRAALATGAVFKAWDGADRGPLPAGSAREITLAGRNDLEAPAIALCPVIGDVLAALAQTQPLLARMSGSGATCFALYEGLEALAKGLERIDASHPEWWVMAGKLR